MTDLFDRAKPQSYGRFYADSASASPLPNLFANDPLSDHFKYPNGKTATDIVRYLIACQKQTFGTTIIEDGTVNHGAMLQGAKSLMKRADIPTIYRGIKYACIVANHPFSFVFVSEKVLPEMRKLCPSLVRFSEKTSKK